MIILTLPLDEWSKQLQVILEEFQQQITIKKNQILIVGCSTSEVAGKKIGTAGSLEIAQMIFDQLQKFSLKTGISIAYQCCEHLNRAIVVEREVMEKHQLEEVTVIPVPNAGGSMATYAYQHLKDAIVVEKIRADFGIDIGDTLIGMHLKPVVVPVRTSLKTVGNAHITLAKTRPKLIGGERAVYRLPEKKEDH